MRVELVKELFLTFMSKTVLIVELLEGPMGVIRAILVDEMIVVVATSLVRKHIVGLTDVFELVLGVHSVAWVLFWMPIGSQLLISVFDFDIGSFVGETESCVVVLFLVGGHSN
jgi:hypothetical protein